MSDTDEETPGSFSRVFSINRKFNQRKFFGGADGKSLRNYDRPGRASTSSPGMPGLEELGIFGHSIERVLQDILWSH
jgi:hypothetical protein